MSQHPELDGAQSAEVGAPPVAPTSPWFVVALAAAFVLSLVAGVALSAGWITPPAEFNESLHQVTTVGDHYRIPCAVSWLLCQLLAHRRSRLFEPSLARPIAGK